MNNLIFNVPLINGKNNSTVTDIAKLANKKYRSKDKLFICDGIKLFKEAMEFGAVIKFIVLDNSVNFEDEVVACIKKCQENGTKILCVEKSIFSKLTSENAPQGIISVCEYFNKKHRFSTLVENDQISGKKTIILESVRDPGNMGTILRNAAALGIDVIILSSDCADIYSSKVVRSSMGAIFKLDIYVVDDLLTTVKNIKKSGRRVLAAAIDNRALILGKDEISSNDVVVLGNEGHGISDDLLSSCTNTLFIPMKENTESLNVAMASAIIMWEISK